MEEWLSLSRLSAGAPFFPQLYGSNSTNPSRFTIQFVGGALKSPVRIEKKTVHWAFDLGENKRPNFRFFIGSPWLPQSSIGIKGKRVEKGIWKAPGADWRAIP